MESLELLLILAVSCLALSTSASGARVTFYGSNSKDTIESYELWGSCRSPDIWNIYGADTGGERWTVVAELPSCSGDFAWKWKSIGKGGKYEEIARNDGKRWISSAVLKSPYAVVHSVFAEGYDWSVIESIYTPDQLADTAFVLSEDIPDKTSLYTICGECIGNGRQENEFCQKPGQPVVEEKAVVHLYLPKHCNFHWRWRRIDKMGSLSDYEAAGVKRIFHPGDGCTGMAKSFTKVVNDTQWGLSGNNVTQGICEKIVMPSNAIPSTSAVTEIIQSASTISSLPSDAATSRAPRSTKSETQCGNVMCSQQATCEFDTDSLAFVCKCVPGYTGDGQTCVAAPTTEPPTTEPPTTEPPTTSSAETTNVKPDGCGDCHSKAACTKIGGSSRCVCQTGFSGDGKRNGIGCLAGLPCPDSRLTCSIYAACAYSPSRFNYYCACVEGFVGDGETCTDIDECKEGKDNCDSNAVCTNTPGSFTCKCRDGFTGDGVKCADINECKNHTDNCHVNAECKNMEGSFSCSCRNGYFGDGVTCTDIDECKSMPCNSNLNSTCVNNPGGFICKCPDGFQGDGIKNCDDIDECKLDKDNCDSNADCVNTPGSFGCRCKRGYSGDGLVCSAGLPCLDKSLICSIYGTCGFSHNLFKFYCSCKSGFAGDGQTCTEIDECREGTNNCDSNAVCVNKPGTFACSCLSGYRGDGLTCTEINECEEHTDHCDVNAVCNNSPAGDYSCACRYGFTGDGFICTEERKPCPDSTLFCSNNAQCVFDKAYKCICKSGYAGDGLTCARI